jgi:F-type H+-transporting ATPase subunit a
MPETELFITRILNNNLAGLGNSLIGLVRMAPQERPWTNYVAMQLLVALIIIVVFAILRPRLSVNNPGKLQQSSELVYEFVSGQAEENVGEDGHRYVTYFGTVFIFLLFANLIGVIPGFESPTMIPSVPAGLAMATFCYYNIMGVRANGIFKYAAHFAGPIWWMAPLMIPIEIVSHLARPLSLTIRLFANMYAGEKVTGVFLNLTLLVAPALFMGLHVFVSVLQAYIFMLLTMIYVGGAVAHEH